MFTEVIRSAVQRRHALTLTAAGDFLILQVRRRPGLIACQTIFDDASAFLDMGQFRASDLRPQAVAVPKPSGPASARQTVEALRAIGWTVTEGEPND